jgi:predicted nicotinamide N-methyase
MTQSSASATTGTGPQQAGYVTKREHVTVSGVDDLIIQSLLDRLQFCDPDGAAERLGISSATWPLFGLLWPSGAQLAVRIGRRNVRLSERILEIGCGLALASLVAHRRGANVTASDCHPLAELFLEENLRANDLPPMKYRHGQWGTHALPAARANGAPCPLVDGRFDLIMGSDLLYERDDNADLAGFIDHHASAIAEVWIVDPDRGNRPAFNRQMAANGFSMREEALRIAESNSESAYKGRTLIYSRTTQ